MRTQAFRLALATGQMRAVMLLLVPVLQVLALVVLAPLVLQVLLLLAPSLLVQVMLSLVVVVILVVAQEEQVRLHMLAEAPKLIHQVYHPPSSAYLSSGALSLLLVLAPVRTHVLSATLLQLGQAPQLTALRRALLLTLCVFLSMTDGVPRPHLH